jgi:hypothetical protein
MKVMEGEYCRRTNLNGVDINRNWDFHHGEFIELAEEFPGKRFSEKETQFLRDIIIDFKPLIFLSVHSGAYGLFYPFAYYEEEIVGPYTNFEKEAMKMIQKKFCPQCDVGNPAKQLHYRSSGTASDWVKEMLKKLLGYEVNLVFVEEVYTNEKKFIMNNEAFSNARFKSIARRTKMRTLLHKIDEVI